MNTLLPLCAYFMADPESFVRGSPTLTTFVLVDGGREVPNTTKSGASSACLNEVSLADRYWPNIECCLGSFVNFQGFQTSIAMEPCSFVVFLV